MSREGADRAFRTMFQNFFVDTQKITRVTSAIDYVGLAVTRAFESAFPTTIDCSANNFSNISRHALKDVRRQNLLDSQSLNRFINTLYTPLGTIKSCAVDPN